jgi:hypothetical protein
MRGDLAKLLRTTAVSVSCFGAKNDPLLVYDSSLSKDTLAPWLAYLGAREVYRKEHKLVSPSSGEITPTFEEEVSARQVALGFYLALRQKRQTARDPYWELLSRINAAGFMKQYVWIHLHRTTWPADRSPNNLQAFRGWSRTNLKNHHPQTRGRLEIEKK